MQAFHASLSYRPRLLAWLRAFASVNAARSVALLLIGVSSLAVLGWETNTAWLVQPFRPFPPFHVAAAFGMFVLGCGLLASLWVRWRWLSALAACLTLVVGSMPLQAAEGWSVLRDIFGRMPSPAGLDWDGEPSSLVPLSGTVFIVLGGVGLLAILSRRRGQVSSITLAAAGGVVMLLAATVVVWQVLALVKGVPFGPFLGSSLQATVCAIVFATYFNALAWSKQAGFAPPPDWLPLSVGAGSLAIVLFVWRALLSSEEAHLAEQNRVAALATRSSVNRQLMVAQRNLRRMAQFGWAPDARWAQAATQMVDDVEGLDGLLWTDTTGHVRASDVRTPSATRAAVETSVRAHLGELRRPTEASRYVAFGGDPSRALMVVPRCDGARCTDLFVGVIDASNVLGAVLSETLLGFDVAIGDSSGWFRVSKPAPPFSARNLMHEPVLANGPAWQLAIWPTGRTAAVTPSVLSDFVLLLGIAVSVLLAISLRLAQSVSLTARIEERASLKRALQSTTDGLWEWDIITGGVTRSPELWAGLGYGTGASHGRMEDWLAIVHPQDLHAVQSRLDDHLESRTESFDAQYRVRSATGRWHNFLDRGRVVVRAPGGQPLRLLGMFIDMTDRRNAEESLRQAETMSTMGRLAARIAHEINNPLAGIQSAFLLVKDAIPPTHPHVKYVGAIEREVQRISQVTRELCETYRPETESNVHAPVQTVVSDAVAFLEQVNRHTGIAIHVELGGIAAVVQLSDNILRQCVCNLVQNAIEASPPGARVTISGAITGDEFVLRVRDMGAGVPAELRERVFEPFVSTKPSQLSTGGMGLGLSLVRRALDAAGGSIEIVEAVGGGAEFVARIPFADSPVHGVPA